jgi:sulfite reductase (ferredoxin)
LISRLRIDLTTLATCGDVVRNVVCCAAPIISAERQDLKQYVMELSRELKPRTQAYFEIWLDGERAASLEGEQDPLYGETYLPRKFKIGFAYEGENTTDIYSHDLGFVAHFNNGVLEGFTLLAGGSLGQSNGVRQPSAGRTRWVRAAGTAAGGGKSGRIDSPRFRQPREPPAGTVEVRNRSVGRERFRRELEVRLGHALEPPRPLFWHRADDYLGWHPQGDGRWFYGVRVLSGRIKDFGRQRIRSGLQELVQRLRPVVRLTVQQNLLLAGIAAEQRTEVDRLLRVHGVIPAGDLPPVLRQSMACPALPTCGRPSRKASAYGEPRRPDPAGLGRRSASRRIAMCA